MSEKSHKIQYAPVDRMGRRMVPSGVRREHLGEDGEVVVVEEELRFLTEEEEKLAALGEEVKAALHE